MCKLTAIQNEKKKELLAEAFNELDEEGKGYLLCDTVKQLFDALNSSNALPPIEPAQYDMVSASSTTKTRINCGLALGCDGRR